MAKSKKTNKTKLGFSKVEVLGHHVTIKETDDESLLMAGGRTVPAGWCDCNNGTIVIDNRFSKDYMRLTFFHELLHMIDFILHNEENKYDEETVNVLARGLNTVRLE